jgi:hypothetical protein
MCDVKGSEPASIGSALSEDLVQELSHARLSLEQVYLHKKKINCLRPSCVRQSCNKYW